MFGFGKKNDAGASPTTSDHDAEPGVKNEANNFYDPNIISNSANGTGGEYDELHVACPPHTTEKKLMAKIDLRVIPFLCILYLLAFLDRVNIANARSFGLIKDLGLINTEYNTALTIFFVPYVAFEIPSNVLMKKLKPHVWLSGCMFMFGLVTVCQGLVHNYSGLLATRFFLWFFERDRSPVDIGLSEYEKTELGDMSPDYRYLL
ncbi:MFS general substrate transporter [Hyaloscypha bicolor E]|uniref:MFS general substrate transporter n=1 Tax=Hyaloscypha bicolor E TaxID=1095630 RepID=A0A2J6SSI6_9HELO|nr:MFS general substrate transporter [Hyaloscypha bicolor E]PMD53746.1 MFS general substrate transporter [Hyaloscypha bicolor E]